MGLRRGEDFLKVLMNRRVIVNYENSPVFRHWRQRIRVHAVALADATGSSRVNVAPWPSPALATERQPPIARAARAPLCRPKPWPSSLVVKPCANTRVRFSEEMP